MKTKTVELPSGAEVDIKRPGVLGKRTILTALPSFLVGGGKVEQSALTRDQLVEFYDYQVATVRGYAGLDDEALDAMEAEDFVALYNGCNELEEERSAALDPTSGTTNSS